MKWESNRPPVEYHFILKKGDEACTYQQIMITHKAHATLNDAKMNFMLGYGDVGILSVKVDRIYYSKEALEAVRSQI